MKKGILALAALALGALSGCASLADRVGIANKAYADQKAAEALEQANTQAQQKLDAMLAQIQAELEAVKQSAADLNAAMDTVSAMAASVTQMQDLAKEFEDRLAGLPVETLRRLVEILSQYLEQRP